MKFIIVVSLLVLSPIILIAQEDSTFLKRNEKIIEIKDSLKNKLFIVPQLPPRTLIIKMKDLKKIKNLRENPFIVIDDTSNFSEDELASGLSEEELVRYKKNKEAIKRLIKLPPSEEETYPTIAKIRNILGVAKTIGVIIILLLSIL
ncbi:MAG: hypothetical protein HY963_01030 [Ignavibacteriales bacterium]|nr:hypothetical protein [Ignavibacteriales bacterium]